MNPHVNENEDESEDLDELYQEIIIDHFKNPRNFQSISEEEALADEENPTCGDQIRLIARVEDGLVADVKYEAHGCAISTASASMMSEVLLGKPVDQVREYIQNFVLALKGQKDMDPDEFGDAIALAGVKRYPLRIKCATMSWHALAHALDRLGA